MKRAEIISMYKSKYPLVWREKIRIAIEMTDNKYPIFCPCGRLATGFHTTYCKKFTNEVEKVALELMKTTY